MTAPFDRPFAALAAASCPAHDEMLVALERELRAVHGESVADALEELARPLFDWVDASPPRSRSSSAVAPGSGLSDSWRRSGDPARAQRASGLRLLLPLGEELRSLIHADVRAIGRQA